MVGIAYQNKHDLDQSEIVNLLVTGFSGTLRGYIYIYIEDTTYLVYNISIVSI